MLIGAKAAGFKVIGNLESRKDFQTGTFEANFKRSFFMKDAPLESLSEFKGIDLVMSHPPCGLFSNLKNDKDNTMDESSELLLNTLRKIKKISPRFFVIDNLPKLLEKYDGKWWAKKFPKYDIFFELIPNYYYGNIQARRTRLFIIGALTKEKFVFRPNEKENNLTMKDVIGDLYKKKYGKLPNHYKHVLKEKCSKAFGLHKMKIQYSWADAKKYFEKQKEGHNLLYHARDGKIKSRFGFRKGYWHGPCGVLIGKNAMVHPRTNLPLSIRERLRIQGAPDDFVLVGERINKDGTWNHDKNLEMTRQTGRFIPVEFCTYVAKLIKAHIKGKRFPNNNTRIQRRNKIIDEQKMAYCKKHKYGDQPMTCHACWLLDECKLKKRGF